MTGFTKSNRYEIFNSRCAPLQVSFLGFAGTTGLANMDYIIGDEKVILEKKKNFSLKTLFTCLTHLCPQMISNNFRKENYKTRGRSS